MRLPLLVAATLACTALAGCSGETETIVTTTSGTPDLKEGKGGILGLLIDDVYRPVPGALVLVQGTGLTATTDDGGEFTIVDLDPGTYIVIANAPGHEWSPVNVDIEANKYTELEDLGRRIFSQGGSIITTQFSVFVPCSVSTVERTQTVDCTADASGDSFRIGFVSDYREYKEASYLVTEMRSNYKASTSQGAYKVVVRNNNDTDEYYASKYTTDGDYLKLVMRVGNVSLDDTEGRNLNWTNDTPLQTAFFPQGGFKAESQGALETGCAVTEPLPSPVPHTCFESRGLGPQAGIKANFVQSLFLGEPETDINEYHVLSPSE